MAVCDVDSDRVGRAQGLVKDWLGTAPEGTGDYRKIIDRDDIDIVHIVTPDHWHAKVAIEAMLSGKDVYCEKPMTLTIEEGRQICDVCEKTGRVFQVGTQQRSAKDFITAIAMIRDGRLGELKRCSVPLVVLPPVRKSRSCRRQSISIGIVARSSTNDQVSLPGRRTQ